MPEVMDFSSFEQWSAVGAQDMAARCRDRARTLLAEFEPPPTDVAVREELDAYVARRKTEIDPSAL
jgi:trimethylamine--corrinoid protein Co-methyltransferase